MKCCSKRKAEPTLLARECQRYMLGRRVCRSEKHKLAVFIVSDDTLQGYVDGDTFRPIGGGADTYTLKPVDAKRALWIDEAGRVQDRWDGHLLDAAIDAAKWLKCRALDISANQLNESIAQLSRETTVSELTVDLCTSTRDRLWQLKRALPFNILQTWPHRNWCKIHVVDCCSDDGSLEWMRENCRAAIDVGLLKIYQVRCKDDFPYWHASVAKNCAANVASGEILVNVDSDNIVGPDFCVDVAERFKTGVEKGCNMILHFETVDGTCGRIACFRKDFYEIAGYDEEAHPMGAQDVDLLKRLEVLPNRDYQHVDLPSSQAIPNTQKEKVQVCDPSIGLNWKEMNDENYLLFWDRRQRQPDLRNQHKERIGVCLEDANPQDEPVLPAS